MNASSQLSMIDTRITNVSVTKMTEQGYIYTIASSDIKPFYPRELNTESGIRLIKDIEYEFGIDNEKTIYPQYVQKDNFISSDKNMILYKNALSEKTMLYFYPSSLGTNCEIYFDRKPQENSVSFWLTIENQDVKVRKEPGGYLIMYKETYDKDNKKTEQIFGVIQPPLLKSKAGVISYNNTLSIKNQSNGKYELVFTLDEAMIQDGITAFISFEMRREKQPDNCLYSKKPNMIHGYLLNYSVIGNSPDYGIGRLMIRYKFAKIFGLKSSQIKEANYYVYNLSNDNNTDKFELVSVLEDWCSLTGNWNKNYKTGDRTSMLETYQHELKFNITEEVRKWCEDSDGQMEHNGVQLKTILEEEGAYDIVLSNDNSLYRTRTEIITINLKSEVKYKKVSN